MEISPQYKKFIELMNHKDAKEFAEFLDTNIQKLILEYLAIPKMTEFARGKITGEIESYKKLRASIKSFESVATEIKKREVKKQVEDINQTKMNKEYSQLESGLEFLKELDNGKTVDIMSLVH